MSKLEALIFDVDGTLSDTERDGHRVAFNRAFADAGLDWDWGVELYGDLLSVTGGKERLAYYLEQYRPDFQPPKPVAEFVADLHAAKTKHYLDILAEHGIPLRPGVERLLTEAREAGLRLAIATTTTPANITALLESVLPGKLDWFDVMGAGDVVPAKKPAPDIYRYVLNELRLEPDWGWPQSDRDRQSLYDWPGFLWRRSCYR
jgi:phosphoglycolate phosphatase-like HAD superfamily hydrolase